MPTPACCTAQILLRCTIGHDSFRAFIGVFHARFSGPFRAASPQEIAMSNSKKPPVKPPVVPVKPAIIPAPAAAPVAAKPLEAAKPVMAQAKPAEAPKPAISPVMPAPVAASKEVPTQATPVKAIEPKVVEPVKAAPEVKPVVQEKPVAPAKPVQTAKPAPAQKTEAVKAEAKPASRPAAKPAPQTLSAPQTFAFPVGDLMKPMAAIQENLRAKTEKALGDFRGHYAEVKGIAESATSQLESSMKAAQSGSREFGFKLFEIAKAQTQDHLDHAKALASTKTLPEFVSAQQAFVLAQFRVSQDRAKDVASLAGRIANDVAAPLRASLGLFARR
jgi:hypothetical protein